MLKRLFSIVPFNSVLNVTFSYGQVCLAVWEVGGTVVQINCLTNTERLLEQLRDTAATCLVCDAFNIDQVSWDWRRLVT